MKKRFPMYCIMLAVLLLGYVCCFPSETFANEGTRSIIVKVDTSRIQLQSVGTMKKFFHGAQNTEPLLLQTVVCTNTPQFYRIEVAEDRIDQTLQEYSALPGVLYAEEDTPVYAYFVPDDPDYQARQWNFSKIGVEEAWEYDSVAPIYGGDPSVIVAVIDTGIAYENHTHNGTTYAKAPDFAQTVFVQGYDFVNDDTHANDDNGHGTHVSMTIAESTNNALGAAGIAFASSIMPIKVLDRLGVGSMSDVALAINYAMVNGAKVINLSLGSPTASQTLEESVNLALSAGITVVAATGNDGQEGIAYPAAYPDVIAVTALGRDDVLASYANYGAGTTLSAPGGDDGEYVWQQGFSNLDANGIPLDYTSFGTVGFSGTSQATPHVSAAAALLIARGASGSYIKTLFQSTATDLGSSGYDTLYGYGRINIALAFSVWVNDQSPPKTTAVVSPNAADGLNGYYVTQPSISLTATDGANGSGVSKTLYHWDSDADATYSVALTPQQGTHTLHYASIDAAGNKESDNTITINVDTILPILTLGSIAKTVNNPKITLTGTVEDATSGVSSVTINTQPVGITSNATFTYKTLLPLGNSTIIISVFDNAGNTSTTTKTVLVTSKARILTSTDAGAGPQVVVTSNTGRKISSLYARSKTFLGGVHVAVGDVDGDGHGEIITASASDGDSRISIYNRHAKLIKRFYAYEKTFAGGVRIAAGDLDGDGKDEIITSPGTGRKTSIRVFTATGKLLRQFLAFPGTFTKGAIVATGDVNGDGADEILVSPDAGGGPQIRVFDSNSKVIRQFFAFSKSFRGGIRLASIDSDNDGKDEIIAGTGPGTEPRVRIFTPTGNRKKEIRVFDSTDTSGVEVAAGDVDGDGKAEIIVGSGPQSPSRVRVFSTSGVLIRQFTPYSKEYRGGINIACGLTD